MSDPHSNVKNKIYHHYTIHLQPNITNVILKKKGAKIVKYF